MIIQLVVQGIDILGHLKRFFISWSFRVELKDLNKGALIRFTLFDSIDNSRNLVGLNETHTMNLFKLLIQFQLFTFLVDNVIFKGFSIS